MKVFGTPRLLNGVLLLNKPPGLSSHAALSKAKRLMAAIKAGHTGTLDPLACGLLPLCFGEATKFSQDLLDAKKYYEAQLTFGMTTSTGDAEGEVLSTRPVRFAWSFVEAVLDRFHGQIMQTPPMYSALKYRDQPLYQYARSGITVERPSRAVIIDRLEVLKYAWPNTSGQYQMDLAVGCTKGTYIRVLAQDIGEALGCGAYLSALCRTGVGDFRLSQALSFEALECADDRQRETYLLPIDALLRHCPLIQLSSEHAHRFGQGQRIRFSAEDLKSAGVISLDAFLPRVRVYSKTGMLLGLTQFQQGLLKPERLIASH